MSNNRTTEYLRDAVTRGQTASSDFDLNPDMALPAGRKLRAAAVLVAVCHVDGEACVILTKRASGMKHHPGQIAFPGGKVDATDADAVAAALREAHEEIGLPPEQVEILGQLPKHETVTGFLVTPVVGLVHGDYEMKAEPGEVSEIFVVPLAHVTAIDNYQIQSRVWQNLKRYYYTVPIGPYYIWGATARMLRHLAQVSL
ncbi:CoA pyrophosphatase [Halocynthiibacter namhaensis]|uniref:CoA pyrophosphatase n=1 Tax=Halocynthiibacter namhaensis TaxID=1290553 RepID=UPI00057997BB|nr:CoA pyrophosphatase [Halocynthiibacter namhaensis]